MRTYEAMFLMDPTLASDWPAAEAEINRILKRAEATVLGVKSWGERKLAYPIGRWKRGLYVLCFFEATPEAVNGVERDVQLSEKTIRILVLRKDKMTPEAVERALAAEPPSKTPARGDEWSTRPGPAPFREGRGARGPVAAETVKKKETAGSSAAGEGKGTGGADAEGGAKAADAGGPAVAKDVSDPAAAGGGSSEGDEPAATED